MITPVDIMSPLPGLGLNFSFGNPRLASWATVITPLPGLRDNILPGLIRLPLKQRKPPAFDAF